MKRIILMLLICFYLDSPAQNISKIEKVSDYSIYVRGAKFEGVIFNEKYYRNLNDTAELKIKRFTPTIQDILIAEKVLNTQTDSEKNADEKYIFENLKLYRRQYIGYFNLSGEKMIYINCFSVEEDWADKKIKNKVDGYLIPTWYDRLFQVFDGGKSFWQTTINLNLMKMISFTVNGVG